MTSDPTTGDVRAHYDALARRYQAGANRACQRAYEQLAIRWLGGAARVLELGAGAGGILPALDAPVKVAVDLSCAMLAAGRTGTSPARLAMDAQCLAFRASSFDAVCCINLAEHVPDPSHLFAEIARVLTPGGRGLAVTPNGDATWLLELIERLRLKLPEGPHRFLTRAGLARATEPLEIVEHRRFLAFPAGPERLVQTIDALLGDRGLFQYVLLQKRGD